MTKSGQGQKQRSPLVVIFFTVFIYLIGFGMIIPLLPILSRDFGASSLQTGLLIAAYSFMQFVFGPFWGHLSDIYGRRPILLGCLVGEAGAYAIFAFSRNLEMLFLARLLAGFFGASISTASAYISDVTPPHERSKGMALIGVAFGLGFVIGPALGGGLTFWGDHISSEPFFGATFASLFVSALCFANFLFGFKFLKESLIERGRPKKRENRFQLIFKFFSKKTVGILILVFFLASFSMASMEASLVLFMGEKFAWGLREVSFGFAYTGVIIVLTQGFFVRRLIPKIGERQTLRLGLIFLASGLAGLALAQNISHVGLAMTILAIGNGFINPSTLGSISLLTDSDEQGSAMGVTQSLSALGRIIGPAVGGAVYKSISINAPFWLGALGTTIGLILVLSIFQKIPEGGRSQ